MIKAAEEAGNLDVALKDIRKTILKEAEFVGKLRSALIYPFFIFLVFLVVLLVILFVVVPKIAGVFSRIKADLPLPTRIMIGLSDLLINYGIFVLIGLGLIAAGMYFLFSYKRRLIMGIFFSLPVISGVVYKVDLTRLTRSLHLLLASGIPITHALELTQEVAMKKETEQMIAKSREMVLGGKSLSVGLQAGSKKLPGMVLKLIEAGEKTGTLDKSLQEISEHLDYEVTNSLKTMTTLIEPVMLVFIGIIVGGLMLSIISPIYGLISDIGSR